MRLLRAPRCSTPCTAHQPLARNLSRSPCPPAPRAQDERAQELEAQLQEMTRQIEQQEDMQEKYRSVRGPPPCPTLWCSATPPLCTQRPGARPRGQPPFPFCAASVPPPRPMPIPCSTFMSTQA